MGRSIGRANSTINLGNILLNKAREQNEVESIRNAFSSGGTQQEQLQRLLSTNEGVRGLLDNAPALNTAFGLLTPETTLSADQLASIGIGAEQQPKTTTTVEPEVVEPEVVEQVAIEEPTLKTLKDVSSGLKDLKNRRKELREADPTLSESDITAAIKEERDFLKRQAELIRKQPQKSTEEVSINLEKEIGARKTKTSEQLEIDRLNRIILQGNNAGKILATNRNLSKSSIDTLNSKIKAGNEAIKAKSNIANNRINLETSVKEAVAPDGSRIFTSEAAILNGQGKLKPPVGNLTSAVDLSDPSNPKQVFATNEQILNPQNNFVPIPANTVIKEIAVRDDNGEFKKDSQGQNIFRLMRETFPGSKVFAPVVDKNRNFLEKPKSVGRITLSLGGLQKSTRAKAEETVIKGGDRLRGIERLREDLDINFLTTNGRAVSAIQTIADKLQIVDTETLAKVASFVGIEGPASDPDFFAKAANFFSKSQQEFLLFRKFITGVAGGEKELEEIRESFFDIKGDSPKTYVAKLDAIEQITKDIVDSRKALLASGMREGSDDFNKSQAEVVRKSFNKRGGILKRESTQEDFSSRSINELFQELVK